MRLRISILALAVLGLSPAHAAEDQVKRGPVPAWVTPSALMAVPDDAAGLMFFRRQDSLIHLDRQGQAEYLGYRIKILHPNALQLGNLSVAWKPAAGAPTVHTIRIHRGQDVIDVLKTGTFEILRREGQLEAAWLDGVLTAVLRVADLRVGDELEVELTTRSNDPTLGSDNAGVLMVAPQPLPGRYHIGLSWDEGQQPTIRATPDVEAAVERSARAIDLRFDNPPALNLPTDAPARYNWRRLVEYSDFADWAAVSRRFAPIYAAAAKLPANSPLKQEAARIAAAHASPMDRARAALKLVQQDVRYIYVGIDNGNLTPATAEETWQRRYGDCKGKTALLLALLAELNIQAEVVLANNSGFDDGLDARLPGPGLFDHVLVRALIDGKRYWLDGTMPPVVPPGADPVLPYRWVLPLSAQGATIEHVAWRPQAVPDYITLYEIDARRGFDQPARITSRTITRGIKGLEQQVQLSALTREQMLDTYREKAIGATWQEIDNVQWRYDERAQASILTIVGTGTVDWDEDGNGAKSLALPGGGFSPPERRARGAGPDRDLPYYTAPDFNCYVTTVRVPTATRADQWRLNPGYDSRIFGRNYYRAFEMRDGAIRMIRGARVEQPEIDAASASKDNGRIAAFDNSMGWIFYTPSGNGRAPAGNGAVPATYDIDWTADDVPCLSRETRAAARSDQ